MKLGYLIGNFPQLSETFVSNEIARLNRHGMDIQVYAFVGTPEEDRSKLTDTARQLAADTCYLDKQAVVCSAMLRPWQLARLWSANKAMSKSSTSKPSSLMRLMRAVALARKLRTDGIEHLHVHWPYATEVAWLVNRLTGIPYSVSIHAHEVAHENGHFPLAFETVSFATYCNAGAMGYLLENQGATAKRKSHLVYHGVDISKFEPLPPAGHAGSINIVTAGRLTRTKGFDRLVRACAQARQAGLDVCLSILGRGALEPDIRAVADEVGFTDHLDMPGWVSHDTVRGYLERAHMFALMADTSFHDGLPNVVLEAMACRRPVVISPLPAAGEAVDNGVEGFILGAADDYDGFVEVMQRVAADSARLVTMGQAARERVVRDHDAETQIVNLKRLFDLLPGASGSAVR